MPYPDWRARSRMNTAAASTAETIADVLCPSKASTTAPIANTAARILRPCDDDHCQKRPSTEQPYRLALRFHRGWPPRRAVSTSHVLEYDEFPSAVFAGEAIGTDRPEIEVDDHLWTS